MCSTGCPRRIANAFTGRWPGSYTPDTRTRRRLAEGHGAGGAGGAREARRGRAPRDRDPELCAASRSSPRPTCSRRQGFEPQDVHGDDAPTRVDRSCSTATSASRSTRRPSLLRSALSARAREFNFAKRTELADLRGRVALLTGGRVKIGYQAGLKLLRAGAQLIVTTRFPRDSAARYAREPDFGEWGAPPRDLRPRPAPHAERRGVLPRAARHAQPARLHRQQRVPDGAAPAGLLRAHDGGRDRGARDMPEHVRKLLGAYEGLRGYHMLPEAGERRRDGLGRLPSVAG